jgi:hypothetical protein
MTKTLIYFFITGLGLMVISYLHIPDSMRLSNILFWIGFVITIIDSVLIFSVIIGQEKELEEAKRWGQWIQ